jgi:hypothetical protein
VKENAPESTGGKISEARMADKEAQQETAAEPVDELKDLDEMISNIRKALKTNTKPSVADLIRLLERRRELVALKPEPVEVRWIDEWQTPDTAE